MRADLLGLVIPAHWREVENEWTHETNGRALIPPVWLPTAVPNMLRIQRNGLNAFDWRQHSTSPWLQSFHVRLSASSVATILRKLREIRRPFGRLLQCFYLTHTWVGWCGLVFANIVHLLCIWHIPFGEQDFYLECMRLLNVGAHVSLSSRITCVCVSFCIEKRGRAMATCTIAKQTHTHRIL